jgi:hypothetical protein
LLFVVAKLVAIIILIFFFGCYKSDQEEFLGGKIAKHKY